MQNIVGSALLYLMSHGDRWNPDVDGNHLSLGWHKFRECLKAGTADHADVQMFCDEVLLPELATLSCAMEVNRRWHRPEPDGKFAYVDVGTDPHLEYGQRAGRGVLEERAWTILASKITLENEYYWGMLF
jgi:hypothetical protein